MARTKISEFSATANSNTDIDGINLAEGCAPSGINDAIRELMAQLKDFQAGTAGDSFNGPVGTTTAAAGAFTTLTTSGAVTLNGGTANGVAYLNGSKVLTTGSALTYNGTGLGVGVASASFALDVGGSDGTNIALRSTGTSSARLRAYVNSAESGVIGFLNGGGQFFEVAGSEQMRLTSTGLGIGTSSPANKLHVVGTSYINVGAYATGYALTLGASSETSRTYQIGMVTGGNLAIYDSGAAATRLTLDSSGNLGLGVTPSAWQSIYRALDIPSGSFFGRNDGGIETGIYANAYRDSAGTRRYRANGVAMRYEQSSDGHTFFTAPSGTAGNAISFTQVLAVEGSKSLALQGATPQSGTGITFPATQSASSDANTLDDYEEGDWTPTIIGTTTAGTGTYNSQQGKYRKIGGVVIVQGYVDWSAHTGTGNMRISNLPFTTAASSNSAASFGPTDCPALTAGNVLIGYTASSSVAIVLRQYPTGGGAATDVPMDTAAGIVFSVSYAV